METGVADGFSGQEGKTVARERQGAEMHTLPHPLLERPIIGGGKGGDEKERTAAVGGRGTPGLLGPRKEFGSWWRLVHPLEYWKTIIMNTVAARN